MKGNYDYGVFFPPREMIKVAFRPSVVILRGDPERVIVSITCVARNRCF